MARPHAIVLGEVLCDLFPPRAGVPFTDARTVVPFLGGAPANVAVQLARLGAGVSLITAVGADPLGARLVAELAAEGVDVAGVKTRAGWRTGVTLVEVGRDGERRFFPLTDRRADLSVTERDVELRAVRRAALVHTGTVGLRGATARAAHAKLVEAARRARAIVSLDVNLRPGMFATRTSLLLRARAALRRADIVKATREEARLLMPHAARSDDALVDALLARGPALVMLTLDRDGALLASRAARVRVPAPRVCVIDATGAGDAFVGAALARLLALGVGSHALGALDRPTLHDIGVRACRAGSLTCTALGATTAMPRARAPR